MNRFITVTIGGIRGLICVDDIRAVGFDKVENKSRLVVDLRDPHAVILCDESVDQIIELLSVNCSVADFDRHPRAANPGAAIERNRVTRHLNDNVGKMGKIGSSCP